jgi:hypothetical protein
MAFLIYPMPSQHYLGEFEFGDFVMTDSEFPPGDPSGVYIGSDTQDKVGDHDIIRIASDDFSKNGAQSGLLYHQQLFLDKLKEAVEHLTPAPGNAVTRDQFGAVKTDKPMTPWEFFQLIKPDLLEVLSGMRGKVSLTLLLTKK